MPLFLGSGANNFIVIFGNIHCIHRLTRPLETPMLLVVCSSVIESEKGESSPPWRESPYKTEAMAEKKKYLLFITAYFSSIKIDIDLTNHINVHINTSRLTDCVLKLSHFWMSGELLELETGGDNEFGQDYIIKMWHSMTLFHLV